MVITTSASLHASASEFARLPPLATSFSVACALRSKPVTATSALSRFWAIGSPILPSPMKPTFAMASSTPVVVSSRLLARGHQREPQVHSEQQHVHHDDPHVSAGDLRKQKLSRIHPDDGGEPHHRAAPRGQPHPPHQIDDREEHRRHLIWRRIGIEPGGKRRPDSTNDRPMIEALAKRND